MKHKIQYRVWDKSEKKYVEYSFGLDCDGGLRDSYGDCLIHDDYIVEQFTGLKDGNGRKIYEGDVIRQRKPSRSYQEHYGENIPTPDNVYNEQLECYIETSIKPVVFHEGAFVLKGDEIEFSWPLSNHVFTYDKESMIEGFEPCKLKIPWDDPEEGDLQYLLNEYGLKSEEELINHLGLEVVGNIHENPELLK